MVVSACCPLLRSPFSAQQSQLCRGRWVVCGGCWGGLERCEIALEGVGEGYKRLTGSAKQRPEFGRLPVCGEWGKGD